MLFYQLERSSRGRDSTDSKAFLLQQISIKLKCLYSTLSIPLSHGLAICKDSFIIIIIFFLNIYNVKVFLVSWVCIYICMCVCFCKSLFRRANNLIYKCWYTTSWCSWRWSASVTWLHCLLSTFTFAESARRRDPDRERVWFRRFFDFRLHQFINMAK